MANAHITSSTDIAAPVNRVLMENFLRRAKQVAVYLHGTSAATLEEHKGSLTVLWRRYEHLTPTTTALSELTGNVAFPVRTASTPSVTNVTGTVAHYGDWILIGKETDLINPAEQDMELMDVIAAQAGRSVNQLVRNEMEDNATQIRQGGVASNSLIDSKLTRATIRNAHTTLQGNTAFKFMPDTTGDVKQGTVPIRSSFLGFCHYFQEPDIRDTGGFISAEAYGDQVALMGNEIGIIDGVRVISTEEASATANAGATGTTGLRSTGGSNIDLYEMIVLGQFAVGTVGLNANLPESMFDAGDSVPTVSVTMIRASRTVVDPHAELHGVSWDVFMDVQILNTSWIRRLTSGAAILQ
jgi:N4-gp56 family major capsid protein